jgi:signal transduction histidine kinase
VVRIRTPHADCPDRAAPSVPGVAAYLLTSLPLGLLWSAPLVLLAAAGALLAVVWVGLPLLALGLGLTRFAGGWERRRCAALLSRPVPPPYQGPVSWSRPLDSAWAAAGDPATGRDLRYLLLLPVLGVLDLAVLVPAVVVPATLVSLPAWFWALPTGEAALGPVSLDSWPRAVAAALVGLGAGWVAGRTLRRYGRHRADLVARLLGPSRSDYLARRVAELTGRRQAAVRGQLDELRRVERDLHDGAQTRLVTLGIDLGLARQAVRADPGRAVTLLDRAQDAAEAALADLRAVVRGIAPPVLADRGLAAAVASLAASVPVDIDVRVDLDRRLPPLVESTAYHVVAESITNILRHSGGRGATVEIRDQEGRLRIRVTDDGRGGARPGDGTGLHGLADRVAGIDGALTVRSPAGGPTTIEADLPCDW